MRVDQVIPSLASRDAIGVHTLTLTDALRAAGYQSEIFYGNCTPDLARRGRHGADRRGSAQRAARPIQCFSFGGEDDRRTGRGGGAG